MILIVEDDPTLSRAMAVNLIARGYKVLTANTGEQALTMASDHPIEAVLLDLGLPNMSGLDVIDGIRGWSQVPIIVVTARHETQSKIEALDRGADDYVTKPFALGELLARLRANLRRIPQETAEPVIVTSDGRLSIDLARNIVAVSGEQVSLTPQEWKIVSYLVRHPNRLVRREELLANVWGKGYENENNYARVYMSQIRQKLEVDSAAPKYFITEPGMGYRFVQGDD
ncbi:response regulator transcription factor [Brevibacterium sp. UMB1308A]|uniref:response regulator transcription factor n=1 Tax=Brevibacterium sp. UMB1308A TaxID=3050608 RepID=UPI00254E558D|nr:response regulator transcription factor [Brevibacterium sp. UMB1308A]MDK8346182.1 response regulator transcription factor [Brevibacterium sp. UMB1308B]MDK8712384.1 response regulator transcription factor [Brevibacterium sp. UMB1308A]